MKKFKILAAAVCAVLLFAFSSCGKNENNTEPSQKPGDNTNAYVTENQGNPETGTQNAYSDEKEKSSANSENGESETTAGDKKAEKSSGGMVVIEKYTEDFNGENNSEKSSETDKDQTTSANDDTNEYANTERGFGNLFMPESKIK